MMTNLKRTLIAGLASLAFYAPNSNAGQSGNSNQTVKILSGQFLMCDTPSQVAQFLTMVNLEGKSGQEAQLASGRNDTGNNVCGIGHWVYQMVGQHSKFEVGDKKYGINEIVVVGAIINGIGTKSQPVRQFGFELIGKQVKLAGFAI